MNYNLVILDVQQRTSDQKLLSFSLKQKWGVNERKKWCRKRWEIFRNLFTGEKNAAPFQKEIWNKSYQLFSGRIVIRGERGNFLCSENKLRHWLWKVQVLENYKENIGVFFQPLSVVIFHQKETEETIWCHCWKQRSWNNVSVRKRRMDKDRSIENKLRKRAQRIVPESILRIGTKIEWCRLWWWEYVIEIERVYLRDCVMFFRAKFGCPEIFREIRDAIST